jgi:DNA gyrase/topoisomerase IV subunit A
MLGRHFGEATVRSIDTFSSVTAGLGVIGHHVERGEVDLPAHTPADFAGLPPATGGRLKVKPVNLELLQRRITLDEKGDERQEGDGAGGPGHMVVLLGRATTGEQVRAALQVTREDQMLPAGGPFISALLVSPDSRLLLITSRYRFLLTTARQLAELQGAGLDIENIHRFAAREAVVAIVDWSAARERERLLLVTSTGYARAYPLDALRPAIEAPVPLSFDNPPLGVPVLAQGVDRDVEVVIVTEGGRGARWPLAKIPLTGVQALNPGRDEAFDRVAMALAIQPDEEVVLLLEDGYARRMKAAWVPELPRANAKAKALVARQAAAVALAKAGPLMVITDQRSLAADSAALPLEASTKAARLVKLVEGERLASFYALAPPP